MAWVIKRDVSTTPAWDCTRCPHRHHPGAACPPTGVWLVLAHCGSCNIRNGRYCTTHRGRST